MKNSAPLLTLMALGCFCTHAGVIVYSDFGLAQAFDQITGVGISTKSFPTAWAASFVPTSTGALSQIDVPMYYDLGFFPDQPLLISVDSSNGTVPGGTVFESWTIQPNMLGTSPNYLQILSVLNPTLTAGTTYWLEMASDSFNSYVWNLNNQGVVDRAFNTSGTLPGWGLQTGQIRQAFDVVDQDGSSGPAVPEPGTIVLLASGLIAIAAAQFRRKT